MSEMSATVYKDLMLRFAKELDEVGVTENLIKCAHDSFRRTPNLASYTNEQGVRKFHYRYNGYLIEAIQTVKLTVKKCN